MNNSNNSNQYGRQGQNQDHGPRIDLDNYVADPSKRNDLKKRLYDSGISNIPMPSVKRPIEENISSRPYSAKMNPNKIQSLSPLKKKIDSITKNIYSNLQESYKEAAAQEAKYKGEGTAEYYKSQHIMVPPPQILKGPKKGGMKLVPKIMNSQEGSTMGGLSSTNRILLNKGPKPGQLPALTGRMSQFAGQTSTLDPNMRLLQGPPAMVMAGFEGGYSMNQKNLELARSKFLLDKLTGKLPPELRGGKHMKLPALDDTMSRGSNMSGKSLKQFEGADKDDEEEVKEGAPQKWSDLDKYIELLLDSKSEEETVFVYLNPNPNADPYDLQVCQYQDRNPQKYYTLSGKGLTLYENDTPIEFLSLGQWLIERDSYNHIKEKYFFKQFKKWKFMRMWKKTIKHQNRMKAQNSLEEKLFMLQDHFSTHLSKHRIFMIEMEKQRFIDPCHTGDTKSIEEFADAQMERTSNIHEEIQKFSDRCRANIRDCISKVLSELRTRIVSEIALDEERKKNNPIQSGSNNISMKKKQSSNTFEKLGFPEGMTYGHRSSLRKECSRFLRFAYLVDFLSLEALANIYTGSVRDMIERLKDLDVNCDMNEVMNADFADQNQATGPSRGSDPLFKVDLNLKHELPIPDDEILEEQIDDFVLKPKGTSETQDFDLLAHLTLMEEKEPGEEDEESEDPNAEKEDEVAVPIFRKVVPNIQKFWIKMKPDHDEYIAVILSTFATGLDKIKAFERWSKHNDLTPYADALEEWDEKVGDSWEEPDALMLDPKTWIQDDILYLKQKEMVTDILESAFEKITQFLTTFKSILEIYWRNRKFDPSILTNLQLINPIEGLQNTIRLFNYYHELFQKKLPSIAPIGLVSLNCESVRSKIQSTPKDYINQLEKDIPEVIKKRNEDSKKWLETRIKELEINIHTVEDFVEQQTYYNFTNEHFQDVRDEIGMYGQTYDVLAEFTLKVKKEDKDSYTESNQAISKLNGLIQKIETEQEGNKEKFKKELLQLIPKLDADINELLEAAINPKFLDGDQMENKYPILQELDDIEAKFKELEALKEKYNNWQQVLETQPTVFENLEECREQYSLRCLMWRNLERWQKYNEEWYKTSFTNIDTEKIMKLSEEFSKSCIRIEKNLDPNPIAEKLKMLVNTFKEAMPVVKALSTDKLGEHHWGQIKGLIKKDFDIGDPNFDLKALIDLNVNEYQEEIVAISIQAVQEDKLRKDLQALEEVWRVTCFQIETDDKTECPILVKLDEIFTVLDESLANINMVLGSRFVKPLRSEAEQWKKWILTISDMIEQWQMCQLNWRYLENIFMKAADIRKSLPDETKKFEGIDKSFKALMAKTVKNPYCLKIVKQSPFRTLDELISNNNILDEVQKSLDDYMTLKRKAFPRFYFLSNDELIDILANSQDILVIQGHLKTCFDNLVKIDIKDDPEVIKGMYSNEGEMVPFFKDVKARGLVEVWLEQLQQQMKDTLQKCMKTAYLDISERNQDRKEFVMQPTHYGQKEVPQATHYGQIIATVAQIMWTQGSEDAIIAQGTDYFSLQTWYDTNVKQIEVLTELVRQELPALKRLVIVALVTVDVHARDIIEELKIDNVSSVNEFKWIKQLKYYWDEEADDVRIRQVSALLSYGYEYMGAASRLVITPLTDKCWITISNALHIKLGANPAGPAGTGKTESTKDLAKAIAIQCIVYNCSDQVDYIQMGRLFSGLCQQGCWTCLDEFNRIGVEVLSVVAQQLLQIRNALLEGKKNFRFEGDDIDIKPEFGCHVTMNPGYAGRTELPDNLKVLFRPVAMMIPNYGLIAEIMLAAEGFKESKRISTKMVQLYKLSSEQLSQQKHYDFGLRAVKSVLVMAGSLKRANPDLVEDAVLIRAMKDANVPKFLKEDLPLFFAIIGDLFPGIEVKENDYGILKTTLEKMAVEKKLVPQPNFILKCIQLFETFNVRFGVMLVGQTGSAKTTCYEVLEDTMIHMRENNSKDPVYQMVKKIILNPKAISMNEMYGYVNSSQEWFDGLASKVIRLAAQETGDEKTWVVFDGPVDAIWIENMNTVLDDNMTLCLSNGQRIKLRKEMRMLFEVQDLLVASPATVSRCGMVYLTPEELGWRPFVRTWIDTFFDDEFVMPPKVKDHLWVTFDATIDVGLEFIRQNCKEAIKTTDLQQVNSITNFLEGFIDEKKGWKGTEENKIGLLNALFAWSYAWGIGGSLLQAGKDRFDSVVRDQFKSAQIPQSFTIFDYWYDMKKTQTFKPWTEKVPAFVFDKELSYFELMVPTQDSAKYGYSMNHLVAMEKAIFFTGASGIGKTAIIANQLADQKEKGLIVPININMSAQTSSLRTQQSIDEKLEKKSRTRYGAPPQKKIIVFIDDINMPAVEEYGAQPPIELIRLLLDRKGMYIRGDWIWKDVEDTSLVACAAPPSGGRAVITPRLSRRFNMFCLPEASVGVLSSIFSNILSNYMKAWGFNDKVKNLEEAAISSTVEIYVKIQEDLRPTPAKFHYLFNLRDVSKVVQGLCMVKPQSIPNEDVFMRLWVNECCRVFHDRLINQDDTQWFRDLTMDLISKNFKQSPDKEELFSNLRFGDLLKLGGGAPLYEYMSDKPKLLKGLQGSLEEYNSSNSSKMNLVLFEDALEHVLRIGRVLKQPRGHIMLIGVGGSGKQSLLKLISFMREMDFNQIELTKGYGLPQFQEHMKGLMKQSGIEGKGISFVMTDTMIINESFIENLNNLLNTGEIPNLMLPEDKDEITNGLRPVCQEKKIVDSLDNIAQLFIDRTRENLHICLCMSPVGETLRVRCRQFPALVNTCTLDWFGRWPEEALLYVSTEFLKELPECSDDVKSGLAEMCMKIHTSVEDMSEQFYESLRRRVYTTPKSYLDLISLYLKVLEQMRHEFNTNKNRLAIGLKKLNDTNTNIAELKIKLADMQPKLKVKNEELAVALEVVNRDKAIADEKEKVVSAEAEIVNKKATEAKAIADDAEADLAAAKPELEAAQAALSKLDKDSIVEIKAFKQPPAGVVFVMECVMIMLGESKDWASIKKVLSDVGGFLTRLKKYDVEATTEKVWKKARDNYISKPNFEPSEIKKSSIAASALCVWANACSKFQIVTKKVAPKKAKYAEVTGILKSAQAELQIKLDSVQKVKDTVAKLEADCQQMQDEKEELEFNMDRSSKRMARAEKLVVLLADEGVRWAETCETIQAEIEKLVGNVFLSCACISYFGAFTGQYREKLVEKWVEGCLERSIPTSDDFTLVKTMGDPVVLRNWGIAGLPSDNVSSENGILTMKAERYALCIDPQQQANMWIKNMCKGDDLKILKFGPITFLRDITMAVRNGLPCIVEDVEENIDPSIDPILGKQQAKSDAGIMQIRLGDSNVDYDENFRFFMTTKMPNPHYIPEICIKVTLINFTVTFDGLQQQLLGDVVIAEKPEIEQKRDQIVLTMAADAKTLKDLENNILKLLSEATLEEILDEDTLIEVLEKSKETSGEINERMAQSKIVEVEINDTRNMYTSVAVRGSILYFVIADLGGVDPMYQNSLGYVKSLFNKAISLSPQANTIEERLDILIDKITRMIYTNISRGLFEKDKLIYSFLIVTSIKRNAGTIDEAMWNLLLRGPSAITPAELDAQLESPDPDMIEKLQWDTIYAAELKSAGQFADITQHICDNWSEWKVWLKNETENPYDTPCPGIYNEQLSSFDKLILMKTFRSELIQQSFSSYVISEIGQFYAESPDGSMNVIYEDIDKTIPLIFVLSSGADPTSQLIKFAQEMNFMEKLTAISLGQGQGPVAAEHIKNSCENGEWVMLQNCHLLKSWMEELEKIVLGLKEKAETIHDDFRLYLTSMPASYFPVSVLQNSVKLTTEPPRGMKANLKRSWQNLNQEFIDDCTKPETWRKLLFSFSFFHANIQERRKFGPLGWNIRYEFNDSDLETSFTMLKLFMDATDEIPWEALNFVTGIINYGGRVTDDQDSRCIMTILEKFCNVKCLEEGYKFSPSGIYYAPADGKIDVYREYVESLPMNDQPEIFGLHENANITYQRAESNRVIQTIMSIQPRLATAAGGMTPDEIVLEKAKDFLDQLPELLDQKEGLKELFIQDSQGLIPSLSTVLVQEMEKFNNMLVNMKKSLIEIDLAIKGFIVMSETLDSMYLCILNNQVPKNWQAVAYPSLKVLSVWYPDMIERVATIKAWLENGNPMCYWLPGMFFPQGFMTGVLQTHARKYKIAIDQLDFQFTIQEAERADEIEESPEQGVYISGLFLDGARWDRENEVITDQLPSKMIETMPVIHFKPQENYKPDPDDYQAPLYKTSVRQGVLSTTGQSTNYILNVSIPSKEAPAIWVQRAAALLCMAD